MQFEHLNHDLYCPEEEGLRPSRSSRNAWLPESNKIQLLEPPPCPFDHNFHLEIHLFFHLKFLLALVDDGLQFALQYQEIQILCPSYDQRDLLLLFVYL